jgi:hypothetical protein
MAKPEQNIFYKLKKLFSQDIIVRNIGGKKIKVIDTHNSQTLGNLATNYLTSRYMGLYSSLGNYGFNQSMNVQVQRMMMFRDYELMEQDPIIASALDLYAEESTVKNQFGEVIQILTEDSEIKDILHNLFYDILNIEFNLQHWVRNFVKYGDWFMKLEITEKLGVINVIPLSVYDVQRLENYDIKNPHFVKFKVESPYMKGELQYYEVAHFRLLNDSNFIPYGKSMIESSRRIWKQLTLMEDAMLIHRIMRAPQKRIFQIDVGNIHPNETDAYMQKIINQIKKVPYVDSKTGDYNLQYNMQNITEDFYIPVRGSDNGTKIDTLNGLEYNAIEDIEYLRNKLMAALRIPKAFLGYEESLGSKATLSAEDIRFARTIERIQKIIAAELTRIAQMHLYIQGYDDASMVNFKLQLTNPSTIYEQEKIEIWKNRAELVDTLKNQRMFGKKWIYKKILELTDEEIQEQKIEVIKDAKDEFQLIQIIEQGNDPVKSGQVVDDGGTVRDKDDPTDIEVVGKEISGGKQNDYFSKGAGRPVDTGSNYKKDSNTFGRDPIGQKDAKKVGLDKKPEINKSRLSNEIKKDLKKYIKGSKLKSILGEDVNLNSNLSDRLNSDEI